MGVLIWILAVIIDIALIVITIRIAAAKGRSVLGFLILAILLPLIALIIALFIKPAANAPINS